MILAVATTDPVICKLFVVLKAEPVATKIPPTADTPVSSLPSPINFVALILPLAVMCEDTSTLPTTSRVALGELVPMPTLPPKGLKDIVFAVAVPAPSVACISLPLASPPKLRYEPAFLFLIDRA